MKIGERRKQLVYEAAGEPVLEARLELYKLLEGSPLREKVDGILGRAQRRSGSSALQAISVEMKDNPSARSICRQIT